MWFYIQMWFPLLTIALTAAICFSVLSFIMGQPSLSGNVGSADVPRAGQSLRRHFLDDRGTLLHGLSFTKLRRHLPVMRGEYWIYVLAGIISITTLMSLYLHDKPVGLLR
jgi:hypothetical protein